MKERGKALEEYTMKFMLLTFQIREIKFKVDDYCGYNEGDGLKFIHGGLSKKVIEVKRIQIVLYIIKKSYSINL